MLPLLCAGFPLIGALACWLLKLAAEWVSTLPWVPLRGAFELVAALSEPWATIVAAIVGAAGGFVVGLTEVGERLTVTVSGDGVRLRRDGDERRVPRARIRAAFLDGRQLVLLGRSGAELARLPHDLDGDRLAGAFVAHDYPWSPDGDPYRDHYRRWVAQAPGLPPGADALLRARDSALRKRDDDEAEDLRTELARLGVVVRDERKRQYWRAVEGRVATGGLRLVPDLPPEHRGHDQPC